MAKLKYTLFYGSFPRKSIKNRKGLLPEDKHAAQRRYIIKRAAIDKISDPEAEYLDAFGSRVSGKAGKSGGAERAVRRL